MVQREHAKRRFLRKACISIIDCDSCRTTFCATVDLKCSSYFEVVILSSLSKLLKTWMRKTLLLAAVGWKLENGRVFLRLL